MRVRFLGTAAGGGAPQWNCACPTCRQMRARGAVRTQDCLAVTGDGIAWYLVNASPDLPRQLAAAPELAPGPLPRQTPLRGVLFTSAELDHTLGLLTLRETTNLSVYASGAVHGAALLEHYTSVDRHPVEPGRRLVLDGGLEVTPVLLGAKRPRYAPEPRPVLGYRFHDTGTGGVFGYAPCFGEWTGALDGALAGAAAFALDGTFLHDDEMLRALGRDGTARSMGHLPVEDSLPLLRDRPGVRYLYTHINNTNPIGLADCPYRGELAGAGAEVADDGLVLDL